MSVKFTKIKLFGEGIYAKSPIITRQRRLNCYIEIRKDEDRSSVMAIGTPGMKFAFNASTPNNLPARGMLGSLTALYEVAGNQVLQLTGSGGLIASASLGSFNGYVGMALNPTQLMLVDGSNGYVFTPGGGIVTVGGGFPNGARTVTNCNGFFAAELPGTNEFYVSNFGDGTTWSGLAVASAVQTPDGIVAVDTLGGLLIVFSTAHLEFWQNLGLIPMPFQYIQNSAQNYGLAAVGSRVHVGNSLLFLANSGGGLLQNSAGAFQIVKIDGYQAKPVSTGDVDNILASMAATSTVTDCTAYSYQVDEHRLAQFNFPSANRSLLYDDTTGFWGEVQSGVTANYAARHIGNMSARAFNKTFIADYSNGNVYTPDPGTYTDNGSTIVREIVSRCAMEQYNRFRIGQVYVDMETGVGLTLPGPGYTPQIELSIAKDNRRFGRPRFVPLGVQGQDWTTRVTARRWGYASFANLRIRCTDPVKFVVAGAGLNTSVRQGRAAPKTRAA